MEEFAVRYIWLLFLVFLALGCGGAPKIKDPGPCGIGTAHLKRSLGPEFGKIRQSLESSQPKQPAHACALVYTRVAEELPDEMPDGDGLMAEVDERLALMLLPLKGTPRFQKVASSEMSPGYVRMNARLMDINGDGIDDFVVEERAPVKGDPIGYRGLRIFDGSGNSGAELFSFPLRIKTVEGLELVPRWSVKTRGSLRLIEYVGGGEKQEFLYDSRQGRFIRPHRPKAPAASAPQKVVPSQTEKPVGKTGLEATEKGSPAKAPSQN